MGEHNLTKPHPPVSVAAAVRFPQSQQECEIFYWNSSHPADDETVLCPPVWDSFHCWPPAPSGSNSTERCVDIFMHYDVVNFRRNPTEALAFRFCGPGGEWFNKTDYSQCVQIVETSNVPFIVSYIMLVGSIISLLTLMVTLAIFTYYKSLQCCRLRVHRNLVVSLILHSTFLLTLPLAVIFPVLNFRDIEWLCKCMLGAMMYTATSTIYWMFVEGLVLYNSIAASVFRQKTPFAVYYLIGWGLPLVFVVVWATVMHSQLLESRCWQGYGRSPFIWIITGPMILVLLINFGFLVVIVRIIVTKVRANPSMESDQLRKAFKATVLLFPLLGISHLLFCINPQDNGYLEDLYMVVNAVLQSFQGTLVSVLYCFLNTEVQTALCTSYRQLLAARVRQRHRKSYPRDIVAPTRMPPPSYKNSLLNTDVSELEDLRLYSSRSVGKRVSK